MERPQYRIKKSTGGWAGKMKLGIKPVRKTAPSVISKNRAPSRAKPGVTALRETKAFEHIAPNFPMKKRRVTCEKIKTYVPKKDQYALLPRRNSLRIDSSKVKGKQEVEMKTASKEMDQQVMIALANARGKARRNIDKFRTLLIDVLRDNSLAISPAILASFLVDLSDKKSVLYWENAEPYQLVQLLNGVYAYIPGVKEAASKIFGDKISFLDESRTDEIAKFYLAALKEGAMDPVKAIWAPEGPWSTRLAIFLGKVFQTMESMDDKALSKFLLDTGIVDLIMTGSDFEFKLGKQLKQEAVRARTILSMACRERLVYMLASLLQDGNQAFREDKVMMSVQNLKIDEASFTKMVWEALIVNLQSCGLQVVKRFRDYAGVLSNKQQIQYILWNNSVSFLNSIKFPARLKYLAKSVNGFLDNCVVCGVLDENAVAQWKIEQESA